MKFVRLIHWLRAAVRLWPCALLVACGAPRPAVSPPPVVRVVAEFYPLYVETLNVVGDTPGVQVSNLVPTSTGCPEDFQLAPGDVRTLSSAQVFIINGAGLEGYLDKVAALCPNLRVVDASAGVVKLKIDGEINPHVWVSPLEAASQVRAIAVALAAADAAHAANYQKNAAEYAARLEALAARCREELSPAPIRQVVAFHDSLPYLARDLNLQILAVMEPAPGQNPSARELADVAARVRLASGRVALLTEIDAKNPAADILSRELGQPLFSLDTCTSGPLEPAAARNAYVRATENNLAVLRSALGVGKNTGKSHPGD